MSENEHQFIRLLKKWVISLAVAAVLGVGGTILVSWQNSIKNTVRLDEIEKKQEVQADDLKEKATLKMVLGIKTDLQQEINYKMDAMLKNQELMMSLYAPNIKFVKPDTSGK